MTELEKLQEEYIEFLNEASKQPTSIAYVHGWRCDEDTYNRGVEYRNKIANAKVQSKSLELNKNFVDDNLSKEDLDDLMKEFDKYKINK